MNYSKWTFFLVLALYFLFGWHALVTAPADSLWKQKTKAWASETKVVVKGMLPAEEGPPPAHGKRPGNQ